MRYIFRTKEINTIILVLLIYTLTFSQNSNSDPAAEKQNVFLKGPSGILTSLNAAADDDGDGINNVLEIEGFTYDILNGLQPWDGDSSKKFYRTDPLKWSTDGDPYSDFMEVSGINMPAAISPPENHPLVAARPVITIKMTDYDVIPLATITNSEGGEESSSFTNETSNSNTVSATVTATAELNPFKMASVEVSASYSHTWTNTQSSTSSFGSNWNNTRSTQPDQAARLKLRIYMENLGGATALEVEPTVNLSLGDRTIATFIPSQMANILTPPGTSDSRFPKSGTIVIEKDENNNDIIMTLDELRAIQMGTPLSLEVVQVSAKVVRWNSNDQDWNSDIDWASFESEIDPVSIDVRAELGNGENHRYQVFGGTSYWDPEYTFEEIISLIFNIEENANGKFIENRKYPEEWYLSSPSQEVIDEWNNAGQPQNLLGLRMSKNTKIVMMSPGSDPKPLVNLASYSGDYKNVLVSAQPNNFPILSVTAKVPIGGEMQTIELIQGVNSFYSNLEDIEGIPDGPGTVTVENARGDITTSVISLPAIYSNAADVKKFSSFIPNPGSEYWIYSQGDVDKPMLLYCLFFDPETGEELETPKEYLTIEADQNPRVFSDYLAYEEVYRFYFNKIRINPNTLKMAIDDPTFTTGEILTSGSEIPDYYQTDVKLGQIIWSYPDNDSGFVKIDLSGTPYHFDLRTDFTLHPDQSVIIDKSRQKLDIIRRNISTVSYEYYEFNGLVDDSLKLIYGYQPVKNIYKPSFDGNAAHINPSLADGYINMGVSPELSIQQAITIEAWIYPTGPGLDQPWGGMILNKEGEYELFRANDGTIRWAIANSSPGWNWRSSHFSVKENEWAHIALVYDSENSEILTYINGTLFHRYYGAGPIGDFYTQYEDFWIGGRQANSKQRFQGLIDEVRIWNGVRNASQIKSTMDKTLGAEYYSTADSNLAGYWRLDESEDLGDGVLVVRDFSINQNDGQIFGDVVLSELLTDIQDNSDKLPDAYVLKQNYPNPFNPETVIRYQLLKPATIRLAVYNMLGQEVRVLAKGAQNAGIYQLKWDGKNELNQPVSSGNYLYRMEINGSAVKTRKMLLLR